MPGQFIKEASAFPDLLPKKVHWDIFTNRDKDQTITVKAFTAWRKPSGISYVYIYCLGAGGRGGPGSSGLGTTGGGGGGGGGSMSVIYPAYLLPDTIYVAPGKGSISTSAPNSGRESQVTVQPVNNIGVLNVLAYGSAGSNGGNPAAGAGGAATVANNAHLVMYGIWSTIAGQSGAVGGNHPTVAPGDITITGGLRGTGGCGGAGGDNTPTYQGAGGKVLKSGLLPEGGGGTALMNVFPNLCLYFYGGNGGDNTGGASNKGGNGGYGSGGGGGVYGTISATAGGDGGDGLVIIGCW